jgi:hypothetical protein
MVIYGRNGDLWCSMGSSGGTGDLGGRGSQMILRLRTKVVTGIVVPCQA